ncbi:MULTISPECIES: Pls/PosA family non-ribosomal peptide synthetase [unclassified Streptomyces]|uniref:Pls/PosA family non-ribosomal peptide synthetase n=1 Tax=unclassified Streptomyces TaxID=2593676 RepID=UPI0007C593A2|nr:Pls/PosA family non-ribosomal peptide synthetase [Streptomyces sp. BoleA5]
MVEKSAEVLASDPASDPDESSTTGRPYAAPADGTERILADILAGVVHTDRVSADSHFFTEMGADSLVMAHFCARVRKHQDLPSVSMKDIYRYPTIRSLAAAFADAAPAAAQAPAAASALADVPVPEAIEAAAARGTPRYVLCGVLQALFFLGYSYLAALVVMSGAEWISAGTSPFGMYLRSVAFGAAALAGLCALPIAGKWLLVGRWKPQEIRIWSLAYFRFWCVRTLIRANPMVLFVGSPLYVLYLRALGARIGRGVAVFSKHVPVCTDLLTIGDGTVIRKDSYFSCYRGHSGAIQTGPVTLGKDVLIGEVTVLDIGTSMGDGAQLGHASSLHTGQTVPAGERWHGSPAQPGAADYRVVAPVEFGRSRRVTYCLTQLLILVCVSVPLAVGGVAILLAAVPRLASLLEPGPMALTTWTFYADALAVSFALFCGALLIGLLLVVTVPRLLHPLVKPDTVHPLYGFRYGVHRSIGFLTNRKFFRVLFGDSSAVVHYLRAIGYDLSPVEQTGSNFGTEVKHENPFLSKVGSGTMVADGLSIMNADYSSTSFRVTRTAIGPHNFLGNHIAYPPQGRTGENCLLATKVMVPVEGPVRENVGLLGSPSFEIPRTVDRDSRFDHLKDGDAFRRLLSDKNRHNTGTAVLHLMLQWLLLFLVALTASCAADFYPTYGVAALAVANVVVMVVTVAYIVLGERIVTRFRGLRPLYCSIYDLDFWRHERYWKVTAATEYLNVLNGTPYKNVVWRLLGVRIGRRVFDDGLFLPERSLAAIGDDCTLNAGTVIQSHSQEDGAFKSDHSTLGAGCTLGVAALVHYGVTVGDGVVIAPDSFVMKGEELPAHARWGGNPAREMPENPKTPDSGGDRATALISGV